jgi:hypothetical protein
VWSSNSRCDMTLSFERPNPGGLIPDTPTPPGS